MAVAARNVCHHLQERDCSHRHVSLAIVHNLHEVPPVPGHLSRQDNHSLHKWAASTCSAGRRWVGRANLVGSSQAARCRAGMSPWDDASRWCRAQRSVLPNPLITTRGSRAQHSTGKLLPSLKLPGRAVGFDAA